MNWNKFIKDNPNNSILIKAYLRNDSRTTFSIPQENIKIIVPNAFIERQGSTKETFLKTLENLYTFISISNDTLNAGVGGVLINKKPKFHEE